MEKYTLIKKEALPDIASTGYQYVHNKSGARLIFLINDDVNKSFCIGFRTPPEDDSGIPHILEHSVLCGSKKYPVKEPFVDLLKSSLNTFLNAMTFGDKTIYPVSSCNKKDFRNLVDIYMDAVLNPNIYTNELIFRQEGWHYELVNGALTYNGVVYNEMKGAFSNPSEIIGRLTLNSLYPDTPYGFESGGDPNKIPTLSYEKFLSFHKKYYHPSNSYIIYYGDVSIEEELEYLNKEYLGKYDKLDIDSSISTQNPFKEMKRINAMYPISENQGTERKALITYAYGLPDKLDINESTALLIINKVLLQVSGAPLERKILDADICDVVYGGMTSEIKQPIFEISLENANEERIEEFKQIVDNALVEIKNNGIDRKAIEAIINQSEFKVKESNYGGVSKGIFYSMASLSSWLYNEDDPFSFAKPTDCYNFLREKLNTTYYEDLIDKYLINNNHKVLICLTPSISLQKEKEELVKQELENYKNSLTNEELNQIVEKEKRLKKYQETPDTKEQSDTIPVLTKKDLNLDVNKQSNIIHEKDVKIIQHNFSTNGIMYVDLLFDFEKLDKSLVPYFGIYTSLLTGLDTSKYTYKELGQEIKKTTGILSAFFVGASNKRTNKTFLDITVSALSKNIKEALELTNEVMLNTKWDSKERIKEQLKTFKSELESYFSSSGNRVAQVKAQATFDKISYLRDVTSGIEYYNFISQILDNFDEQYQKLVDALKEIQRQLLNKNSLIISFTGNDELYEVFEYNLDVLLQNIPNNTIDIKPFVFKKNIKNRLYVAPYDVSYVASSVDYKPLKIKTTGALNVLNTILNTDYLWNNVRVLGGAYGCSVSHSKTQVASFSSYRDPNVDRTLDAYKNALNYVKQLKLTNEELLKYIIGTIGSFDYPVSSPAKGFNSMMDYLFGEKDLNKVKLKKQIINCTLDDILELTNILEYYNEHHVDCVIGNEEKLKQTKYPFDEIHNLLK